MLKILRNENHFFERLDKKHVVLVAFGWKFGFLICETVPKLVFLFHHIITCTMELGQATGPNLQKCYKCSASIPVYLFHHIITCTLELGQATGPNLQMCYKYSAAISLDSRTVTVALMK